MSNFKYPQLRYKTLDKCFRNTVRRYFIEDLIKECENALNRLYIEAPLVSRRQIFDDIAFMESSAGWQINLERKKDGKKTYYRYVDPTFSINKMPLTEADFVQLQSAVEILSHFDGMPQFSWLEEMVERIQYYLPENKDAVALIGFDSNPYLTGIERLSELFHAIRYQKVLKIVYQDFNATDPYPVTIHPYFLKQYNNRWFLFGLNEKNSKPDWILALDRIKDIQELPRSIYVKSTVRWKEYFDDMIGVTKTHNLEVVEVTLHFRGPARNYVRTKSLHGSQKVKSITENILEVRLNVILNYELEQTILSFGENVTVINPKELADSIWKRLNLACERYTNASDLIDGLDM